jgi:hypothetical protein
VGLPEVLADWARAGGVGPLGYQGLGNAEQDKEWPGWLLRPQGPDELAAAWVERGLFPDAVTLNWTDGSPVAVFGSLPGRAGRRLEVDRERGVPLLWKSAAGNRWHFREYEWRESQGQRRLIPKRIVVEQAQGGQHVFVAR